MIPIPYPKKLIERAYLLGEALGLAIWCQDEAGPFQTQPYPGQTWQPTGRPAHYPHEYVRRGTAKLLTLFHPATGQVRVKGTSSCTNEVLHGWLKAELSVIVAALPAPTITLSAQANRAVWESWRDGLSVQATLPAELPPLRMLLIWDNLSGHKTPAFFCWLCAQGILPLYTPLGGSWLNMAESIQRILKRRALDGQQPQTVEEIIGWLEATAQGWNRQPTPFVWGGRRAARRKRARDRCHAVGGSGAYTRRPLRAAPSRAEEWRCA